mmetsp:Transcript_109894/g.354821  ORF Transcript_109894/g.354821 Transcript_109894/m.354821 type:complete len:289 (+) Transcript_109894:44-910(+)
MARRARSRRQSSGPLRLALAAGLLACAGPQCWRAPRAFSGPLPRRSLLERAAAASWLALLPGHGAAAFENALPDVTRFPKRNAGPEPKDLGLKVRKLNRMGDESDGPMLKECGYGPNCFSTTGDMDDPSITTLLSPWKVPKGMPPAEAFTQLQAAVKLYPPGQSGADGGGFKVVTAADGYLYAQFESLKKGKVDDVEFKIGGDGQVQVRSAGRFGMKADFGSNAKRLNYLAAKLQEKGWTAPLITKDTHPYYFSMNSGKTQVQCVGINCPVNYELLAEEPGETLDASG